MPLRLIEFMTQDGAGGRSVEVLQEQQILEIWQDRIDEQRTLVRILVDAQFSEAVIDLVEEQFSNAQGFRLMIFPIEATLPRPETPDRQRAEQNEQAGADREPTHDRISREELYDDIAAVAQLSWVYVVLVVLSAVVAGIGLLRDDVAVIIGAMVIAPLLGPNVALALATTLGDFTLLSRSVVTNGMGVITALAFSIVLGLLFHIDPEIPALASRTEISLQHILLALASGIAGALAFTRGAPAALIGVMVAVALLPPLVTCGMLLGSGQGGQAVGAGLLVVANVICVNLAGVITFLLQGVRPRSWWEAERARKATRAAIALWATLLALLSAIVYVAAEY